jgi:Trypsin-like peptidase domain
MRTRAFQILTAFSVFCIALGSAEGQSITPSMSVSSTGSGFFVSYDGKVLTNNHVIDDCSAIKIDHGGYLTNDAFLLARDMSNDLALLQSSAKPSTIPGLRSQVRLGETIYVHGFPVPPFLSSSGNFTVGTVTALTGPRDDSALLQISAPIQPGNSGGPLMDKFGNVVGVIVAKIDVLQNVNFAIKSNVAINFFSSNRVSPPDKISSHELLPEDIAERASAFSVRVLCYKGTPSPSVDNRKQEKPTPTSPTVASYWTYNESVFALKASGDIRQFVYETPRAGLIPMGVRKGTLLFDGRKEGDTYVGRAHVFSKTCQPTPYFVSGNISNDDQTVTLRGRVPVLDDRCNVKSYNENTLKFRYRGKTL